MANILLDTKKLLGLDAAYQAFDTDIIIYINNALMILEQLGIGKDGFSVVDGDEQWEDFLTDINRLESVKTYVYIRTRLLFDPPANSTLSKTLEDTARELEWRMNAKAEQNGIQ